MTNLLRNINNVDRDLSYYGVEVVGYESKNKKTYTDTDSLEDLKIKYEDGE